MSITIQPTDDVVRFDQVKILSIFYFFKPTLHRHNRLSDEEIFTV